MESQRYKKNVEKLQYHRNMLAAFSFIVLLSNLTLAAIVATKRERVVVLPPSVDREFWIEGNAFSSSYVEQFGLFLAQLILNKSPASVDVQNRILLKYVVPSQYPQMKRLLEIEKREIVDKELAHLFFPTNIEVLPEKQALVLEGERVSYLGEEVILNEKQKYILQFAFRNGLMLLKEMKKVENEN